MASLNVQGLFTNIPLNDVIDICIDNLLFDVNTIHVDSLDRNDITELWGYPNILWYFGMVCRWYFVDVMFLCQSYLNDFVNHMNAKYPIIKLTSEFVKNGSLLV